MLQKDGSIVLDNFQRGQADSPYLGYAHIRNADVFEVAGIARLNKRLVSSFSTDALPLAIVNANSARYVGTAGGTLYRNGSALVSGLGIIYDLVVHKGYLLIFRQTTIDTLNLTTLEHTSNWKTGLESGYYHKAVNDTDNDVYIANGPYIAKITGFAGGSPPTATFTANEKTLPTGEYAQTVAVLGTLLAIGIQGGANYIDVSHGIAKVLLWDRASSLFEDGFVNYAESGVLALFNIGNSLLVAAGTTGNIYETNGVSSGTPVKTLNFNTDKNATAFIYPNAVARTSKEILIGSSTFEDAFPDSKSIHGVWSLQGRNAYLRNTISTGGVGEDQTLKIGAIYAPNSGPTGTFYVGWSDGTTYGVDELSNALHYSTYPAVIESELHIVGEALKGKSYGQLSYTLGRPLISGQTITVSYRTATDAAYTQLYQFTSSNTDGRNTFTQTVDVPTCETLQLKVALAQADGVVFGNNIELFNVKLQP